MKGHTALVTGAGRGIGEAIARRLARAGAKVVAVGRSRATLEKVAKDTGAEFFVCDVSSPAQVENLARMAGPVRVLVNNAGVAESAPLEKTDLEMWRRAFDTNVTGAFLLSRAFLPGMRAKKYGRIVNVASVFGKRGGTYVAAYSASKHALLGLNSSLAAECADDGILVNAVCPGYVDTPMTLANVERIAKKTGRSKREVTQSLLASAGQARLLDPAAVAEVVLALARPECSHTGAAIDLL